MVIFLDDRISEQAKLLIFCGKISPRSENKTGPIPKPYASPAEMTQIGNNASLILFKVESTTDYNQNKDNYFYSFYLKESQIQNY